MKQRYIVISMIIIAAIIIVIFSPYIATKWKIEQYVTGNAVSLEEFAFNLRENGMPGKSTKYDRMDVTNLFSKGIVEFNVTYTGSISEGTMKGFYYLTEDDPMLLNGDVKSFVPSDNGWKWEEKDGDNWEYVEKIMEQWYYYERHY